MKSIPQRITDMADSPTFLRDRATLLGPFRLGTWFIVINATLLGLGSLSIFVFAAVLAGDRGASVTIDRLGFGQYVACMLMLGLGAICTLLVPLRAAGILTGPRFGKYFDQIVLSGISPVRFLSGKILAQNLFLILLLAASLPYFSFSMSLGGTKFSFLLYSVLALILYTNLLTLTTLAMSMLQNDIISALLTIVLFAIFYGIGLAPLPAYSGVLTPSHMFICPLYEAAENLLSLEWAVDRSYIPLGKMLIPVSTAVFFAGSAVIICMFCGLMLIVGPLPCLVKVNSTFGEVVLPGDAKRRRALSRRFELRRRSELSFFYENRMPWITRWEILLRWGPPIVLIAMLGGVAFGIVHVTAGSLNYDDFYVANLFSMVAVATLCMVIFQTDRSTELAPMQCGPLRCSAGVAATSCGLFCLTVICAVGAGLPAIRHLLNPAWLRGSMPDFWFGNNLSASLLMTVLIFTLYLTARALALSSWTGATGFLKATLLLAVVWLVPYAVWVNFNDYPYFRRLPEEVRESAVYLATLSPLPELWWMIEPSIRDKFQHVPRPLLLVLPAAISLAICWAAVSFISLRRRRLRTTQIGYIAPPEKKRGKKAAPQAEGTEAES